MAALLSSCRRALFIESYSRKGEMEIDNFLLNLLTRRFVLFLFSVLMLCSPVTSLLLKNEEFVN